MLYPLLHWDTRFPAGYTGETVDLLMMDAAARTLRGASEVRRELDSNQESCSYKYLLSVSASSAQSL